MKDLEALTKECMADLASIGIKCGRVRNVAVNTRAKSRWGLCKRVAVGVFDISIAEVLLKDDTDIRMAKNTIVHELLHTVPGCFGHKGKWKLLAETVNKFLPQYNIKRTASYEVKGLDTSPKEPIYRYCLRCTDCGREIFRQKQSKVITNYKKYRCGKCGGKFERVM